MCVAPGRTNGIRDPRPARPSHVGFNLDGGPLMDLVIWMNGPEEQACSIHLPRLEMMLRIIEAAGTI